MGLVGREDGPASVAVTLNERRLAGPVIVDAHDEPVLFLKLQQPVGEPVVQEMALVSLSQRLRLGASDILRLEQLTIEIFLFQHVHVDEGDLFR